MASVALWWCQKRGGSDGGGTLAGRVGFRKGGEETCGAPSVYQSGVRQRDSLDARAGSDDFTRGEDEVGVVVIRREAG